MLESDLRRRGDIYRKDGSLSVSWHVLRRKRPGLAILLISSVMLAELPIILVGASMQSALSLRVFADERFLLKLIRWSSSLSCFPCLSGDTSLHLRWVRIWSGLVNGKLFYLQSLIDEKKLRLEFKISTFIFGDSLKRIIAHP